MVSHNPILKEMQKIHCIRDYAVTRYQIAAINEEHTTPLYRKLRNVNFRPLNISSINQMMSVGWL